MPAIFLLYIAIVIAFFLIGIIIGYLINPKRKLNKQKEKPLSETVKDSSEEVQDLGQDSVNTSQEPLNSQYPSEQRYGYYNNYNAFGNSYYGNNGRNRTGQR